MNRQNGRDRRPRRFTRAVALCSLAATLGFGCSRSPDSSALANKAGTAGGGAKTNGALSDSEDRVATRATGGSNSSFSRTDGAGVGAPDSQQDAIAGSSAAAGQSMSGQAGSMATPTNFTGQAGSAAHVPANSVAACADKMVGEYTCDGATLYRCAEMGAYEQKQICPTAPKCGAGLKSGVCGSCDPGQARCTGSTPETCDELGVWKKAAPCASQALCNEMTGSCDRSGCAAGEYRCNADALEVCARDLTGFELESSCDMGLCNKDAKRCNECKPNTRTCEGASTLSICGADGEAQSQSCNGATPYCLEDKCVQCMSDTDCPAISDCLTPVCNKGSCEAGDPKPLKATCDAGVGQVGVCDLLGNCFACIDDSDCHDPSKRCNPLNILSPCESRSPIEVTASLLGGYSVTLAPGFDLKVDAPAGLISISYGLFSTVPCSGGCVIPKASEARTFTVSGPSCTDPTRLVPQTQTNSATLRFAEPSATPDANNLVACASSVTLTATTAKK